MEDGGGEEMKNVVIGVLAGVIVAQSPVWVYADSIDRLIVGMVFAFALTLTLSKTEDKLRERRMNAWRTRRIINQMDLAAKQNRP